MEETEQEDQESSLEDDESYLSLPMKDIEWKLNDPPEEPVEEKKARRLNVTFDVPPSPEVSTRGNYERAQSIDIPRHMTRDPNTSVLDPYIRHSLDGAFPRKGLRRDLAPLENIPPLQGRRRHFSRRVKQILRSAVDDDYNLSDLFNDDDGKMENEDSPPIRLKEIPKILYYTFLRHMNYYRAHLLYFVCLSLFGGILLYLIEGVDRIDFVDALFMATSAVCVIGLATRDISKFRTGSQVLILFLIIIGGQVLMTLPLVFLRRYRYKRYIDEQVASGKEFQTDTAHGLHVRVNPSAKQILNDRTNIEYQALIKIPIMVVGYWAVISFTAILFLCIYLYSSNIQFEGVPPVWAAIFLSFSAFHNSGLSIYENSVGHYYNDPVVLPMLGLLIILGNVGFPIALRLVVWVIHRYKEGRKPDDLQIYKYILRFPRRCFTHMFPSYETKLLLIVLLFTLVGEIFAVLLLDWDSRALENFTPPVKILNGLFQSVSTRIAGLSSIDLDQVRPASKVLYAALMYISAYPVVITLRNSNVSEIFINSDLGDKKDVKSLSQRLLFTDIVWIYLGFFFICIAEADNLEYESHNFTLFKIFFEVISAYSTGWSLGYPGTPVSFSGVWKPGSKLILVVVMLLGRHRGLPESVDRAVQMPKDLQSLKFNWDSVKSEQSIMSETE